MSMVIAGVECIRPDATFDSLPYVPGHSLPKWAVHPMSAFPPDSDQTADIADGPFRAPLAR
jgi:hypothetical protein